jgi:acyl dehydratase
MATQNATERLATVGHEAPNPDLDVYTEHRTISAEMIDLFASVTGDDNALHVDDEIARSRGFPSRIAHGKLVQSIALDLIRRKENSLGFTPILIEDSWRSEAPVLPNDQIFVRYVRKRRLSLCIIDAEVRAERNGLARTAMTGRIKATVHDEVDKQ